MTYDVFINGGFANIPKQYQGVIVLDENLKSELLKIMSEKEGPLNQIHDGYIYHIKLVENDIEFNSVYDDLNLPKPVRQFIDTIKNS